MDCIIAVATAVIAVFAISNFVLAMIIKEQDKKFRQQTTDLFQAIAISNILSDPGAITGSSQLSKKIDAFKKNYKGETPIFE